MRKINRRNFLQFGTGFIPVLAFSSFRNSIKSNSSIVISTWNDGIVSNKAAWEVLDKNGSALDAVETGAIAVENEITCCVGLGANPDRDGLVTLDASIMDHKGNCGAVAFLERIKHPVSVARKIMENTPHVFLVGEGAQQFALNNGFNLESRTLSEKAQKAYAKWKEKNNYTPQINRENKEHEESNGENNHDTIGLVALDKHGNLAGSCTTSGQGFKMRGRVGDVPLIGSGLYVDNEIGAAVATGQGEDIIRIAGCHTVIELMRQGNSPENACKKALERLIKLKGKDYCKQIQVSFIAIDKNGAFGAYSLQKGFSYAVASSSMPNQTHSSKYLIS